MQFPKLADQPIVIPENPFWEVFRRFGRDEAIAMIFNILGAALTQYVLTFFILAPSLQKLILSLVGPIIEKVGFFPAHLKEAWDLYSTTPQDRRADLACYIKKTLKGSSVSLLEDILVHDPVYIIFMYGGLVYSPETPAFLIAAVSFIAAIFVVAGLEVAFWEGAYLQRKRSWKKAGFGLESYYEARFFIRKDQDPNTLLMQLAKEFSLPLFQRGEYHDRYFVCNLPEYSGRVPKVRLRKRMLKQEKREAKTAQIIYTRSAEMGKQDITQFRYFPQKKDKFYAHLDQAMPQKIEHIENQAVRKTLLKAVQAKKYEDVTFTRTIARDPEKLLVAVDAIAGKQSFYVLELKVRTDIHLLKLAMRYVMLHFPVMQTTLGKEQFASPKKVIFI